MKAAPPQPVAARFPGTCSGCRNPFAAGAAITRTDTYGRGAWVAACCAPTIPTTAARTP